MSLLRLVLIKCSITIEVWSNRELRAIYRLSV